MELKPNLPFDQFQLVYKVARFSFSAGLFVILFSLSQAGSVSLNFYSLGVLGIYVAVSLVILVFSQGFYLFEFLLDELFLFLLALRGVISYTIFSIFLFFPIFFAGFSLETLRGFSTLLVAYLLHVFFFMLKFGKFQTVAVLQMLLNFSALTLLFVVAFRLKRNFESQKEFLKKLEELKKESEFYKRLYEIAANLAHELKNPLASVKGALQLFASGNENPKLLEIVFSELNRINELVRDFLNLSAPIPSVREEVNVRTVVEEICKKFEYLGKSCEISGENLKVRVEPKSFYSAIENLLSNSFYWSAQRVAVTLRRDGRWFEIVVEDDGPGIEKGNEEKIFEPFYSKRSGGSGLGLSIVKKFSLEHGGVVFASKSSLGGAKFVLRIPLEGKVESSHT